MSLADDICSFQEEIQNKVRADFIHCLPTLPKSFHNSKNYGNRRGQDGKKMINADFTVLKTLDTIPRKEM